MRGTIGITFKSNGGYSDYRGLRKLIFQIIIFCFTLCKTEPPAIIVDYDGDMIGIIK